MVFWKMLSWIKQQRSESVLLILVLMLAAFLRLYRIEEYMTFLGDEGRDMIVVRKLLVNFDPILVGPGTSIGNMYLGPLYYYLIAPFLWIANFSPVGPSIMVALFGVATVFLVWRVTREWFWNVLREDKRHSRNICVGALMAAFLYAVAPVVIVYSRSSWNPNIMPFFSLVSVYSIWRVYAYLDFKWLIVLGVSFAFVLNSHYLGLLLVPVLALFYGLAIWKLLMGAIPDKSLDKQAVKKDVKVYFLKYSLLGVVVFLFLMSPLVIFDARHNWRNFEAMKTFFTVRQQTVSLKPWRSLPNLAPLSKDVVNRLIGGGQIEADKGVYGFLYLVFGTYLVFLIYRKQTLSAGVGILVAWIVFGLVGLGLYKQEIYDHYFGFLFPAPFILIGGVFEELSRKSWFGKAISLSAFLYLAYLNIWNTPIKYPPNRQMERSIEVVREIGNMSRGKRFNFAVIAERNYEGAYQYFFEKDGYPFVVIDPQRIEETLTDQLFVICELPSENCDATHNPKAEIANFGWSKVEETRLVDGVTIFRLVHY